MREIVYGDWLRYGRDFLSDPYGYDKRKGRINVPVPSPLESLKPKEEPKEPPKHQREDVEGKTRKRQKVSLKL